MTSPTWTYAVAKTGAADKDNISTVDSGTKTDILVGAVTSAAAGTTTGPITDPTKVGTSSYTLTGTYSATINGSAFTSSKSVAFNIHIVQFTLTVADMAQRRGAALQTQTYTISYSPVHADVPVFTYQNHVIL